MATPLSPERLYNTLTLPSRALFVCSKREAASPFGQPLYCKESMWAQKTAKPPVVPEIALKAKRIGLMAMCAGLNGKVERHRRPQRQALTPAVRQA
jgi:hypothetical protein